jgi:acyl-CoA synthetase (AMP-forming)/AMP-acid ligase II
MNTTGNIADRLDHFAATQSDHRAIVGGGCTISYSDLADLVRRIGGHLADRGVGPGDIVGVCLRDTAAHLCLLYGVARAGAAILPMDVRWTAEERDRIATFFGAKLVLTEPGEMVGADLNQVQVDDAWWSAVGEANPDRDFPSDDADSLVLSLSSGTTGIPKGPMHSHKQMHARFATQTITLGFSKNDKFLSALPIYFGAGRSFVMGMLYHGATVMMMGLPYEPRDLVEAIARENITVTLLVPTLLRRLMAIVPAVGHLLPGPRLIFTTGAILHPDEREELLARVSPNLHNYYGSTEGGGLSVLLPRDDGAAARSVGRLVHNAEAQVVGDDNVPLVVGEVGRVRYRGGACAIAFYNDPEATKEAFHEGWFYPGDLGKFDKEGRLYLVGRIKDMIIRGGINIYPAEIEQVLLGHGAVDDVAAVAWPSRELGEEVAAFVVAAVPVEEDVLLAYCRAQLARYKVPRAVLFVDALPRNGFGKVLKKDLAARLEAV